MKIDQSQLLEPQREHAMKLLDSLYMNGVAADLSETGTGKTYTACWIAKQMNCPVLVICPKIMISNWERTMKLFGIKAEVINYELVIRGKTKHITINNVSDASYQNQFKIDMNPSTLVIMDECHKCKALTSKTSLLMASLKFNKYKMLPLSASAATNPLEMRSFGYVTGLHNYKGFGSWVKDMGAYVDRHGHYQIDIESNAVLKQMATIHNELFNKLGVASRMLRKAFGNIFPKNTVTPDPFHMGSNTDKINDVYLNMDAELAKLDERASNYSNHQFAIIMEARRRVELYKVPTMVEHMINRYENNLSPVCFVNFTETVHAIKERLDRSKGLMKQIGYIVGGQTPKQRTRDIDAFQADEKRIMLVNIKAGNAGVSLHDLNGKHPRESIISPTYSAIDMIQSMGRIHRAEAKTPTVQNIMFAAQTIEETVCRRVADKLNSLSVFNDNELNPHAIM